MAGTYRRTNSTGNYNQNDGVPGVVYILRNEAFKENWLKIGCSRHSGHVRARDMNKEASTGLPAHHICIFEYKTLDCGNAEKAVFRSLNQFRKGRQEFFEADLAYAQDVIRRECAQIDRDITDARAKAQHAADQEIIRKEVELKNKNSEYLRDAATKRSELADALRKQEATWENVNASREAQNQESSTVDVACPECGVVLVLPASHAKISRQKFRCKNCVTVFFSDGQIFSRVNDSETKQEPTANDIPQITPAPRSKFEWDFWLSCIAAYVIFRFFGIAGGAIALFLYFSLKPHWGRLGAATAAGILSISIVLVSAQYLKNGQQTPAQAAADTHPASSYQSQPAYSAPVAATQIEEDAKMEAAHYKAIYAAHPDASEVTRSQVFQKWLEANTVWKSAMKSGSSDQIIAVLNSYKKDQRALPASQAAAPKAEPKTQTQPPAAKPRFTAEQQADIDAVVRRAVQDYPYLDTPAGYDDVQKIMRRRDELIREGVYPSIALTRAVNAFAPAHAP